MKKAFTLIELLVVIAIIGILAVVVTVNLTSARKKARDAQRISQLSALATGLEMYRDDNNNYPKVAATADPSTKWSLGSTSGLATTPTGTTYVAAFTVPAEKTYTYSLNGVTDGSSYKLSVPLEAKAGSYFVCIEGNCAETTTAP